MFHKFFKTSVKVFAELGFYAWTFNPFQDMWDSRNPRIKNLRSSGITNLRSSRITNLRVLESQTCEAMDSQTCETMQSGICEIRGFLCVKILMHKGFRNQEEAKSKTLPQKSGFDVWTSGRLVNVWNQPRKSRNVKDIHVQVHTSNIP
jgi:hypothetical protein